ncbi:MAG: hypothetical protein ABIB47_05920 [Candidatus Woesearchaeota archaeon]
MATLLDFGVLTYLIPLFVFFFVFLIIYALFNRYSILGEDRGIHALIAFILALLFVLVADLRNLLTLIVPFFVLFFIIMAIIFIGVMLLGMKQEDITSYIKGTPAITVIVIVIVVIIFLIGVGKIFPSFVGFPSASQTGIGAEARRVIFNPKVLGIIFIFVVSYFLVKAVGTKK